VPAIASTPKSHTQAQLTKKYLELAGSETTLNYQELKKVLWWNFTNNNSLRLTAFGFRFLIKILNVTHYSFTLKHRLANKNLIQLERYFPGVYFLYRNELIIVFDESDASMLALLDGDLKTYLENLEINN
jgi:hypothetical protein